MSSILKKIIPKNIRMWLYAYRMDRRISRSPDRRVLTETIIPALAEMPALGQEAEVLWVGCQQYTRSYYSLLEKNGARCTTLEIDPAASKWGRPGRHVVGDILDLETLFPNQKFDAIFCNGIFGWGVDTLEAQLRASEAMAAVTKERAWLLLGWNTNRIPDPITANVLSPWFTPADLPGVGARYEVADTTHVYDLLRRR